MGKKVTYPQTFFDHHHHSDLMVLLQELFVDPDPVNIEKEVVTFLVNNSLGMKDFPLIVGEYSRNILYRNDNGFEAMVARWSKGAVSSIHGHPFFTFYCVVQGSLEIDNYKRFGDQVEMVTTETLSQTEHFIFTGKAGTFDNNIHQVRAIEETLSIHISSDDSTKGEVFNPF